MTVSSMLVGWVSELDGPWRRGEIIAGFVGSP
jgi:hypothetical protein